MSEQALKEEILRLIKEIESSPYITQRGLSTKLGISLGKTNYLLKELITRGLIKARDFSYNPGKMRKVKYILTRKGMEEKIKLTHLFLERKRIEYETFRKECENLAQIK